VRRAVVAPEQGYKDSPQSAIVRFQHHHGCEAADMELAGSNRVDLDKLIAWLEERAG